MLVKTRFRALLALAALAGAVGLPLLAVVPAHAEPCLDPVVDGAVLLGSQKTAVQAAVSDLQSAVGAEVRVITIASLKGASSLDSYVQNWCRYCTSLSAPGGGLKTNVIIFAMSYQERSVGIFYGDTWQPAFTGQNSATRIWQDIMVPRFQNSDYAGGFIEAIKETQRVLTAFQHSGTTPPQSNRGNAALAGWITLGVLVLAGGGLGAGAIVKTKRTKRDEEQKAEAARKAAYQQLASRRKDVLSGLLELDMRKTDVDVTAVYESVSSEMAPARAAYYDAMAEANKAVAGDTTNERRDLTTEQYKEAEKSYDAAGPQVERARQAVADIDRIEDEIKQQMDGLPATLKDEASKNKEARALASVLTQDGLRIPPETLASIDSLDGDLAAAQAETSSMQQVLPVLAALRRKRDDAVNAAVTIKAQSDELTAELSSLTESVAAIDLTTCEARLTQIKDGYNEACWQGAPDVFAAAKTAKAQAEKSLDAAQAHADKQDWMAGAASAEAGFAAVAEFKAQAAQLDAVLQTLQEAPGKLKTLRESAQSAIDAAWDYAKANTDDDAVHEQDITKAEHALASANTTGSKPDWLAAIALAEAAETIAHQALASCQSEVAQAEKDRIEARKQKEREVALRARLKEMREQWELEAETQSRSSFWGFSSGTSSSSGLSGFSGGGFHGSSASFSGGGGFHGSSGSFGGGGGFHGSSGHF